MRKFLLWWALGVSIVVPVFALDSVQKTDAHKESVADYWFRTRILQQDPDTKAVLMDEQACEDNKSELELIWENISTKLMSPFKTLVTYADRYKTRVESAACDESQACGTAYEGASCSKAYIKASIPEIDHTLKDGYEPVSLKFADVQSRPFVEKITLAGEAVRLCGIDQDVESLILDHLFRHVRANGLSPLHLYYFGSRVMPRSEVIQRDQERAKTMPISDDGVMKNAVRIQGMTLISDLEMMVLVSAQTEYSAQELKQVASRFKKDFAKFFRDFPVSVKFIYVKDPSMLPADPFDFINQVFSQTRNRPMSRYQFVKI